ncbi:hypothetical protein AB0G15_14830 [Streptosporangium sp. NPDC023825]|uniref:hypothetical protein n=1 Tax=Streptosporangium sp. NPDC023825 TaxID=3154909 RepID=UPI003426802A
MCNPRRVRVRATRELAEAWGQEVRRQVTRSGRTVGEARVREPLASTVGGPTLTALTAVLARTEGWTRGDDGVFRHELDGGLIAFDPGTRELEIVARVSGEVTGVGEASSVVETRVTDTVEAEGVGTYYDDNWGGVTEQDARRAAEQNLERSLAEAAEARRAEARRAAEASAGDEVESRAARRADEAFVSASAAREEELRERAAERLTAVGVEGRTRFHHALAEAYRDAVLAFARARRADNIHHRAENGVLEIEFDLQI